MIKLCIFDLDGTTINSLRSIAYFANETLRRFGCRTFSVDEYRHLAGGGARVLWNNLVAAVGADPSLHDAMMNDWLTTYEQHFMYLTEAYEGVTDMLRALKQAGIKTAIVTNKAKPIADKLCGAAFGTDGSMLDIVVSDHPGFVLKPAPDELVRLMKHFGVKGEECMYCGDHTIDMQTGRNAGTVTVGVTWGFHTREALLAAGADHVADYPLDIVTFATRVRETVTMQIK